MTDDEESRKAFEEWELGFSTTGKLPPLGHEAWQAAIAYERARDKWRPMESAPDLLAALVNLFAMVEGECPSLLEDNHHYDMVVAAIAKARGE